MRRLNSRQDEGKAKRWLAFLNNHREVIAAFDFFTVPTLTFGVLYCFFVIEHQRRRILHFKYSPCLESAVCTIDTPGQKRPDRHVASNWMKAASLGSEGVRLRITGPTTSGPKALIEQTSRISKLIPAIPPCAGRLPECQPPLSPGTPSGRTEF